MTSKYVRKMAVLFAVGGCTFSLMLAQAEGCRQGFFRNLLGGIGAAGIAAGVNAAAEPIGSDFQEFVAPPIEDSLQATWSDFIRVLFPAHTAQRPVFID